jgi:hypothetical protein
MILIAFKHGLRAGANGIASNLPPAVCMQAAANVERSVHPIRSLRRLQRDALEL